MSAHPATLPAPDDFEAAQPRSHGLLVYVLVIVSGFLLLMVLDGVFSHLIATLDARIDNERQRLRIGEVVLNELKVLEANIYKMAITHSPRGQRLIQEEISVGLEQLEETLNVLEHGGTLERITRINIESQDNMRQRLTYQKDPSEVFVLEVIDLRPKLARIHEKTLELGRMMANRGHQDANHPAQHADAIKTYLRAVPPEFIRMNENAARLLFISKQKTKELERIIHQRALVYQIIEGVFSTLVIFVFSLFAYQFNRKLQTANKHLQDSSHALLVAKQAAETANRAKSAFLANMSHELRTPLNAVLGYAQILQRDATLDPEHRQQVDIIKHSGDYLLTLINDVLDLAKIEAGRLDLIPGPCEVKGFFAELANLFQLRAREKNIDFRYDPSDSLPFHVEIDEKRLRQIGMNLLSNAVKFTEQGEVRLTVDYRAATVDSPGAPTCGELMIRVSDSGIGIPLADQEAIFDPFRQAGDNEYKQQGTGLGLPITRSLVAQMGGEITLESEAGRGSVFSVRIPVPELATTNPVNPPTETQAATGYRRTDGVTEPLRVLAADDVALNRSLVRGLLEPLGFEVTEVENGAQAVAITEQQAFDIILMDLVMPEMDGLTATRHILAHPGETNRRIIALTARAFEENRAECLEAGCCDHLSKPLDNERLMRVLAACLPLAWEYPAPPGEAEAPLPASALDLPPEVLEALEDALIRGELDDVDALLAPIRAQDAELGETLRAWLENYQYQNVMDWIETQKSAQPPAREPALVLAPEALAAMEEAMIRGDVEAFQSQLEPIRQQDAKFGATLQEWVEHYDYQRILDWIDAMKTLAQTR